MVCLLDLERNDHKISCSLLHMNRYKYVLVVPVNQNLAYEYSTNIQIKKCEIFLNLLFKNT